MNLQAIHDEHEALDEIALTATIVTQRDGSLKYVGENYEATVRKQKARRTELQAMCAEAGHLYRWVVNGVARQSFCTCCGQEKVTDRQRSDANLLKTA